LRGACRRWHEGGAAAPRLLQLPPHTGKYNAHTLEGLGGWGCGLEQKVSIKKGKQIPIRRDSNFLEGTFKFQKSNSEQPQNETQF
jgi:hypothetical protein